MGWITPDALDELKPLCYLDAKNLKDSKDLKGQMQKAVRCFYHLTENLVFMGVIEGTKNLSKGVSTNQDIVQLFSGLQRSFPTAIKEIDPFIPILQKMMRNIVRYFKETIEPTLDPQFGTIPISNDQILGYIEGYFPIVFGTSPHYEEIRMPYARYSNQSLCLVKDGQIVSDTGIFLVHKGFSGLSLMKNAFMYYGAESEYPFTMSPLELFSFTLLKNETTTEKQLRLILGYGGAVER